MQLVDEVASWTIWAKTFGVKGLAVVSLVFRMSVNVLEIIDAMRKLALVPVLALTILNELAT